MICISRLYFIGLLQTGPPTARHWRRDGPTTSTKPEVTTVLIWSTNLQRPWPLTDEVAVVEARWPRTSASVLATRSLPPLSAAEDSNFKPRPRGYTSQIFNTGMYNIHTGQESQALGRNSLDSIIASCTEHSAHACRSVLRTYGG